MRVNTTRSSGLCGCKIALVAACALWLASCSLVASTDTSRLGPSDESPLCPGGCDDGVTCTLDRCVDGECAHSSDHTQCGPGLICSPTLDCVKALCENDADCEDTLFCNGQERCFPGDATADPRGCVSGAFVDCEDGFVCTLDRCDEETRQCEHTVDDSACDDAIACTLDACAPNMAFDDSGCTHTPDHGACSPCFLDSFCDERFGCIETVPKNCADISVCTADRCDEATGQCVHEPVDTDDDGYPANTVFGAMCSGTDCKDDDFSVYPGAPEICNRHDDNCNGFFDEGCAPAPDTCGTAMQLPLNSGQGYVAGRFSDLQPKGQFSTRCGNLGPDAVYFFDLDAAADVTVETTGSEADTILAVASQCAPSAFEAACHDDIAAAGGNLDSRVWIHRLAPGRVFVLVKAADNNERGRYRLRVSVNTPSPDECGESVLDITGGGLVVGFSEPQGQPGQVGTCGGAGTPEVIAAFEAPKDGSARFAVISSFDPVLYVRSACDSETEIGCAASRNPVTLSVRAGRDYFVFLDGLPNAGGTPYGLLYEP